MKRAEFIARRNKRLTLPSGIEVTVRKAGLQHLLKRGAIPAPLLAFVDTMLASKGEARVKSSDFPQVGELTDIIFMACVIEPKVIDDVHTAARPVNDDEIALSDFDDEDREFIANWANKASGASKLEPFRQETGQPVDATRDGSEIWANARVHPGNNGRMVAISDESRLPDGGDGSGARDAE